MLQQQETLYFGCINRGLQFQTSKSNHSYGQGRTSELMLMHQFLPGMDCISRVYTEPENLENRPFLRIVKENLE